MTHTFEPLSLDRRAAYLERFARCPEKASDYSFANIWGWAEEYGLEWSWGESHVWLRQTRPQVVYWAPVGPWGEVNWAQCPRISAGGMEVTRVPEALASLWREAWPNLELREARGHWDYLYSTAELISLKGNKYHKKKNHLNQFKKQFTFEYRSFEADCVEAALELQAEWRQWHEHEGSAALKAEDNAIARVLKDWDQLPGLMGCGIYIDGHMVAYTVAEPLSPDSLVIHFEKGKPGVRGVYQAINQMFLENEGSGFDWVNREQDLDDENLRYAKMTYHPAAFLKKYAVTIP